LIVCVGVDDEVRARLEGCVDPRHERRSQAFVAAEPDDVMHAVRARDRRCLVTRPIVDHQPLDHVDARHGARQVGQCGGTRGGAPGHGLPGRPRFPAFGAAEELARFRHPGGGIGAPGKASGRNPGGPPRKPKTPKNFPGLPEKGKC